jgi:hypothetical protein
MIEGPRPDLAAWAPPGKPRRHIGGGPADSTTKDGIGECIDWPD